MPGVSGPELDKMLTELQTWAVAQKLKYRELLTKDYPFGATKIDPMAQISRFLEMRGQDYEQLVLQLNTKYLGAPNAYDLVNKDLAAFLDAMIGNALKMSGVDSNA